MAGSIFISTLDTALFSEFDIDSLDTLEHVQMERLLTLDFDMACTAKGVNWVAGEPAVLNESEGFVIFPVSKEALEFVIANPSSIENAHHDDQMALASFIKSNGAANIFELASF